MPHPPHCFFKEEPWKTSWMSATAVGEVSFTLTSVSGCCPTERRLPFLLTCGQELEKCVLGTEMILLSGFSHEQMGRAS